MTRINIVKHYEFEGPILLGTIAIDGYYDYYLSDTIKIMWDKFQLTRPSCDSEFIDFLCDNMPIFLKLAPDEMVVV